MPCSVTEIENGDEISLENIFSVAFSLDSNVHSSEFSFLQK